MSGERFRGHRGDSRVLCITIHDLQSIADEEQMDSIGE
jgi:hypothetical protein